MAQASNAPAREPSMEEILASIRRIIEDSDTARRPVDDMQGEPLLAEADRSEELQHEEAPANAEVETFRSEFSEPEDAVEEPAVEEPAAEAPAPERTEVSGFSNGARAAAATPDQDARHHGNGLDREESALAVHRASASDDSGARGAIISDFAGRQVAAAFEELSEAFSASRRRSYDEIAEEIMRPMLQEWLDNNLPLLVERLVREEIERVARGGVR